MTTTQQDVKWTKTDSLGDIEFIRAKDLQPGQAFEGIFDGTIKNQMSDKFDFKLLVNLPDGRQKTQVINAAGNLTYKMSSVNQGELVRIVYQGQSPIKKGKWAGKMSHTFVVFKAEDEGYEGDDGSGDAA